MRVLAHRLLQRFDQHLVVDRLLEELRRAGLEGAPAHLDRAVAGEHHDRLVRAGLHQAVQHSEAAETRHAHVQHDRADRFAVHLAQELLGVAPAAHAQAHGADQQGEAVAHRLVIVDQLDQG